jgi:hypothetical protein
MHGGLERIAALARRVLRWIGAPRLALARALVRLAARGRVLTGPFRGMVMRHGMNWPPLALGVYERELHPAVDTLVARGFRRVVNFGASDGYYAVGLAMRLPAARVIAFEMDASRLPPVRTMAAANGVADRLTLLGERCTTGRLDETLGSDGSDTLLFVDIDGGEIEVLDPAAAPALRTATILVETHDCFVPGVHAALVERFAPTHVATSIPLRRRTLADFPVPVVRRLLPSTAMALMAEHRPEGQGFLLLEPIVQHLAASG